MSWADGMILLVVAVILFFAGRRSLRDMKAGKCAGCSCGPKKQVIKSNQIADLRK